MMRGGMHVVRFGPSPPGMIGGGDILGFIGDGEPGPRKVDEKAKAKARAHRKMVKRHKHKHKRSQQ